MNDQDLTFTPAWRQRELVVSREVSPVDLVQLYLSRIDRFDGQLHSYLTVDWEGALSQARVAEREVMQ